MRNWRDKKTKSGCDYYNLMFDIICFFFIYFPVMSLIRGKRSLTRQSRFFATFAVTTLLASYYGQQILNQGKTPILTVKYRATRKLLQTS